MTVPINIALYRLLVKSGASEKDAEDAARVDASSLTTPSADLREAIAEMKASLLMWIIVLLIGQTGLLVTILRVLLP